MQRHESHSSLSSGRRPPRPPRGRRWLALVLLLLGPAATADIYFYDYNASLDFEVNTNLVLIPGNERVASGPRFSSAHILGFESERRAWTIAPSFMVQRFGNIDEVFGNQEFFNLHADGRYDWTERLSTSLNVLYQLDRNLQLPDPRILFLQRPILRQGRQVSGRITYRITERLSASVNGTYLDNLFEEIPDLLFTQTSFDYQDLTAGANYIWNERLSFNASVGLSQFKDFAGRTQNRDRFFNVGTQVALAENWTFAGMVGLRQTDQTFRMLQRTLMAGDIVRRPGAPEWLNPAIFIDGTVSEALDQIFGAPVVIVGGFPRQRLIVDIPLVAERQTTTNTYDLTLTRIGERSTASVGARRMIRPAGIQAQTDVSMMTADLGYRFSERLNGALNFNQVTEVIQGLDLDDQGRTARFISANLNYALTRQFNVSASYRFFQVFGQAFGLPLGDADGQAVVMSLSYNGDRLEW